MPDEVPLKFWVSFFSPEPPRWERGLAQHASCTPEWLWVSVGLDKVESKSKQTMCPSRRRAGLCERKRGSGQSPGLLPLTPSPPRLPWTCPATSKHDPPLVAFDPHVSRTTYSVEQTSYEPNPKSFVETQTILPAKRVLRLASRATNWRYERSDDRREEGA